MFNLTAEQQNYALTAIGAASLFLRFVTNKALAEK
jgi:hypothetical protein